MIRFFICKIVGRISFLLMLTCTLQQGFSQVKQKKYLKSIDQEAYLKPIKDELVKEWPKNRTINLVFHGHSVPSGYVNTPHVNTFGSYPYLLLRELKTLYPYAVINVIVTAIGGENSVSGEKRFKDDVLTHKPDVLFIDYALNDRGIGLENSKAATEKMIKAALERNIKVILLTPSADQGVDLLMAGNDLQKFSDQIRELAEQYKIGLADSFAQFVEKAKTPEGIKPYMGWVNHPNEKGNQLIANEILKWFKQ